MYQITAKPGKDCFCSWCQLRFSEDRQWGGFVSFADPYYCPGLQTVYGLEVCTHCYRVLMNMNTSVRLGLALAVESHGMTLPRYCTHYPGQTVYKALATGSYPPEIDPLAVAVVASAVSVASKSPRYRSLSTVNAVHLCLVSWAETKGAPYLAKDRHKQSYGFNIAESDMTSFPNKRALRKPDLNGNRL